MTQLTGRHVAAIFVSGFGVIIAVNLVLAVSAVRSFPGLEVANSYVASQTFEADRAAQLALGWHVSARLEAGQLLLDIRKSGQPVQPVIERALLSRATSVAVDQYPDFVFDGARFKAPVDAANGNWNLRLEARAADGTLFRQRIIVAGSE